YLPFLCLGFVIWGFISVTLLESCRAFQEGEGIIKQKKIPFSVYVVRVLWRNFIVLLHAFVVFVPVAVWFKVALGPSVLIAIPGLLLLCLNVLWLGLILAILSTRFHDVPLIASNALQIVFFSTPILWKADALGNKIWLAELHPVYHLIELVRAPLLGSVPAATSWLVAVALLIGGSLLAALLFRRVSRRIV